MKKYKSIKIPVIVDEQNEVILDIQYKYTLVRERDGLTKQSNEIAWLEWDTETKLFKESHDEIGLDRSLILDPNQMIYTWMTTEVLEILENTETLIRFKTLNSTYTLIIESK